MSSPQKYVDMSSFLKEVSNPLTMGDSRGGKMRPPLSIKKGDNVLVEPINGRKKPITIKVDLVSEECVCGRLSNIPWDSHEGDSWQGYSCGASVSVSRDRVSAIFHNPALSS